MAISETPSSARDIHAVEEGSPQKLATWHWIALGGIVLIAAVLNFYNLGQQGYPNMYYAAAIKSMLQSWHNFFFVSFDPGGFVTVDKPPLGFWFQVASAKLFGLSPFSVLLPEALAGVIAVGVLFQLVRRVFGPIAGLIAALVLALMPVSVVTSRNNTIDSILVLTVLLAAWAVSYAAEMGKLRWLLVSALLVGLGFNIKMLEAYLVVPALGLVYLLGAPLRLRTRIGHLVLATLLLLVVSLSWATIVDLTPANQRPYVGSSGTNSELNLAFGYNGIQRLTGNIFGRGNRGGGGSGRTDTANGNTPPANGGFPGGAPAGTPGGQATTGTGANNPPVGFTVGETGSPGILRFFNQALGGQISWLLPFALLSMLALAWQSRLRLPLNRRQQALVLWGVWLLTMMIFFSIAGFFHSYYLTMVSPAVAALVGAGLVTMWQAYARANWRGWLLPLALLVTAAVQVYLLSSFPIWSNQLSPFIIGLCALAALMLIVAQLLPKLRVPRALMTAATAGLLALLIAPTVWSAVSIGRSDSLPSAGPAAQRGFGGGAGGADRAGRGAGAAGTAGFGGLGGQDQQANPLLVNYLLSHQGNTRFLLATMNSMSADAIILDTGEPVMALGGFAGADQIVTQPQLVQMINNNTVRFFLLQSLRFDPSQLPPGIPAEIREELERGQFPGGGVGGPGGFGAASQVSSWVTSHCTVVPAAQWQSSTSTTGGFGGAGQLYDCANHK